MSLKFSGAKQEMGLSVGLFPGYERVPSYFEANGYILKQNSIVGDFESKSNCENDISDSQNMNMDEITDNEGGTIQLSEVHSFQQITIDSKLFVIRPKFLRSFRFQGRKHHEYFELIDMVLGYVAKINHFRVSPLVLIPLMGLYWFHSSRKRKKTPRFTKAKAFWRSFPS